MHHLGAGLLDCSITARNANGPTAEHWAHSVPNGSDGGYRLQPSAPRRNGGRRGARQHAASSGQIRSNPLIVRRRGQEEVLVRRVGESGQPMSQPYHHLLDAARDTLLQASRVNGNAERSLVRARGGGRAGHAVVKAAVAVASGSSRRRGGGEPPTEA